MRLLLCLALALAAAPASSAEPEPPAEQRAQLDVYLNGAPRESIIVLLRGDDVLASVEDLENAGLRGFEGRRELAGGRLLVSLRSLAPLLRFEVDERALALRLTVEASLLGTARLDLRPSARPAGLVPRGDPSGFFNYSAQLRTDGQVSGFAEAGGGRDGVLLYSAGSLLGDGRAVRGLTNVTMDEPAALRRWIGGDTFASAGGLGGSLFVGGFSLVKEYGLDPYLVRGPLPRLSGYAATPATLDVYVNGVLVREQLLPPGGYDLANLPVTSGSGMVRTVLRDAFGRTEVLDWRYYYTAGLLARGLADYGYSLGFERRAFGVESFDYGRPVLVARHRVGLTNAFTLGGRLEAANNLVSGGPTATFGFSWGEVEASAAASQQAGTAGAAGSLSYAFVSRAFTGSALLRVMSTGYATASQRAIDDRPRVQANVFAGLPVVSRLSITASYSLLDYRDAGLSDTASLQASLQLSRDVAFVLTGSRSRAAGSPSLGLFATLSWAVMPGTVADASLQSGNDGTGASTGVQKSLPLGTGFGYRARVGTGLGPETLSGLLQYQWEHGRYELEYDRTGSTGTGLATVSGGAAFIAGRGFLTRPVQDGYALARVGAPGVRGYLEGQEVGRTDGKGDLLVPNLLPYYGNRLSIADTDLPLDYRVGSTLQLAAPAFRSGALVQFPSERIAIFFGQLVVEAAGKELVPAYGELTVRPAGGPVSSPVGRDGRFYFENLPPGPHPAEVEWSGGSCAFELEVPEPSTRNDLGRVRCLTGQAPSSEP